MQIKLKENINLILEGIDQTLTIYLAFGKNLKKWECTNEVRYVRYSQIL